MHDLILGGQDGLVNVLGIVLGIAAATQEVRLIIIAGLAAAFAESISMAAVAYTSTKAETDFFESKSKAKIKTNIDYIYSRNSPTKSAVIVGISAIVGSVIPLLPFFMIPIIAKQSYAVILSIIISAVALFITGSIEGKMTLRKWYLEGIKLTIIGMIAALAGFLIGKLLGVSV